MSKDNIIQWPSSTTRKGTENMDIDVGFDAMRIDTEHGPYYVAKSSGDDWAVLFNGRDLGLTFPGPMSAYIHVIMREPALVEQVKREVAEFEKSQSAAKTTTDDTTP